MKRALVISAHGAAEPIFRRNLPGLLSMEPSRVYLVFPEDDPIREIPPECTPYPYLSRQHAGPTAGRRFSKCIELLELSGAEESWFLEYDCVVSGPLPLQVLPEDLWCNWFDDHASLNFKGLGFAHPPLILGRKALFHLGVQLSAMSPEAERGFWDRQVGLAVRNEPHIALCNLRTSGLGFAYNSIEEHHLPELRSWIREHPDYAFFHGVKSELAFREVQHYFYANDTF